MSKSFRSSRAVLDVVNRVFGRLAENPVFREDGPHLLAAERWGGEIFPEHESALADQPGGGGRYRIDQVPAGTAVDVSTSKSGCTTVVIADVTVTADQALSVNFTGANALQCN